LPKQSQQATLRSLDDAVLSDTVARFVAAWERNDVDTLVAMLTDDARMTMPPLPSWYSGREAVASFLRGWPLSDEMRWRPVPSSANAQLAFGGYTWDEETGSFTHRTTSSCSRCAARRSKKSPRSLPKPSRTSACPIESQPDIAALNESKERR
jgi:SnoaL-like domain